VRNLSVDLRGSDVLVYAGWQREPSGKIKEQVIMTDSLQFYEKFVKNGKPIVFRRAVKDASAMKNWINNKYLIDK